MVVMLSFEVRSLAVCIDAVAALRGGRGGGPPQAALRRGGNSTALIVFFLNIIVPSVDKLYDRFLNRPKSAKNLKKCRACGARKRENKMGFMGRSKCENLRAKSCHGLFDYTFMNISFGAPGASSKKPIF